MLETEPKDRLNDINYAINCFQKLIGDLNVNTSKYCFSINTYRLEDLKKDNVIEDNMTYPQFINNFLPNEFRKIYGTYDNNENTFKFIGDKLYMECNFDNEKNLFIVTKIYEILINRTIKYQKLYCEIEGKIVFVDFRDRGSLSNNNKLNIILKNHSNNLKSLETKTKLFDDLFGKWQQSLYDSIETTKEKNGKIYYKNYNLIDGKLILVLKQYKNNSIDNVNTDTRFLFEEKIEGRIAVYPVGSYEDVSFENNEINIIISLLPNIKLQKIKEFLDNCIELQEDYIYKIKSYKKQINAINALRNDECSSKNLKDIILELETPSAIPSIKSLKYNNAEMNDSQKEAVKKSIFSDSISLIQGPPGTGKTKVINVY